MSIIGLPLILFKVEEVEDLPDHFVTLPHYDGSSGTPKSSGGMSLGVNDGDTVKVLGFRNEITEGQIRSLHLEDDTTDYQNTSGFNAFAAITVEADNTGILTRHIKIFSSPTTNSITSATLLYEYGSQQTPMLNADGEKLSITGLKIQDDHFLVIQNVDDSRAGLNSITIGSTEIEAFVVERQS